MRISDWSSDVCSSDLQPASSGGRTGAAGQEGAIGAAKAVEGAAAASAKAKMRNPIPFPSEPFPDIAGRRFTMTKSNEEVENGNFGAGSCRSLTSFVIPDLIRDP